MFNHELLLFVPRPVGCWRPSDNDYRRFYRQCLINELRGKLDAQSGNVIFLKSETETNIFPPIVFVLPCQAPSSLWRLESHGRQNQLKVRPESKQTRQSLTNVRFLHDSEPLPLYLCEGDRLRS